MRQMSKAGGNSIEGERRRNSLHKNRAKNVRKLKI
jgi:hypothetical protein